MGKPSPARRGSFRRFVIGSATVEVQFRKRDATDSDVLDALERAARFLMFRLRYLERIDTIYIH